MDSVIPFMVVDTAADIPASLAVRHAARLRIGELTVERLVMDHRGPGPYIDAFKAEVRRSRAPRQLAFDSDGQAVDLDDALAQLARRRFETYGFVHPTLHRAMTVSGGGALRVAVWLHADLEQPEKSARRFVGKQPAAARTAAARRQETVSAFLQQPVRGLEVERVDELAPVVVARVAADDIPALARRDDVAGVFLYDPTGEVDLSDSIAIANSDDAHALGFTGRGINVAVYEDGPDDVSNLVITAQYTNNPAVTQHARHTHGIIRNSEAGAPHGHAPSCNLHSANSMDLDAIRWAAQDRGCTVISQSFHRPAEQRTTSSPSTTSTRTTSPCTGRTRRSARRPATAPTTSSSTTRASTA